MADKSKLEFFLLRYIPDAVKDEFVNIGVVLLNGGGNAEVRFTRDWRRVRCIDPGADIEMLEALEMELRARLAEGGDSRERILHVLSESLSNTVQCSPIKGVLTDSPQQEIGRLAGIYLESKRRTVGRENTGRGLILEKMRDAFEQAGVWQLMRKKVAVAPFTHKGDPLKLDCGYRPNGVIKFFHAVSLASDVDAAKVLAFSYPQIREGIARLEHAKTELTAVVENNLDRNDEQIAFALETFERNSILVAPTADLPRLAEVARRELRV
ncbi:MAG: DUF3037 domain-containing protein [Terriglobales bacterium]